MDLTERKRMTVHWKITEKLNDVCLNGYYRRELTCCFDALKVEDEDGSCGLMYVMVVEAWE